MDYSVSKPRIIDLKGDHSDWIIPLITVIIALIVGGVFLWLIRDKNFTPLQERAVFKCGKGQCPTNFYNGIKRCSGEEELEYDPTTEVCNGRFVCDDPATGFAVLENQGTLNSGLNVGKCPEGVECRCVREPQCPYYVTNYFRITGGTPYTDESSTTLAYTQGVVYTLPYNTATKQFNTPPLVLPNPATDTCFVGESALDILYPSTCIRGDLGEILDNNGNSKRFKEFGCVQASITCPSGKRIGISDDGSVVKCVSSS